MRRLQKFSSFFIFIAYMVSTFCDYPRPSQDKIIFDISQKSEYTLPKNVGVKNFWLPSEVDISSVDRGRKLIAFTFDDAPSSGLEKLVAVFLGYNATHPDAPASATLFCNGCRIHRPVDAALCAAVTAGFELGNHTQNHKKLTALSSDELQNEINATDERLFRYDGKLRHLFRAPYGELNPEVCSAIPAPIIAWFVDTLDWTGESAEKIYDTVWENKASGVIVLMHDGYENTLTALKRLLPDLYDEGYQAVTVSQMANAHQCPLKIGSVYTRARKKTPC